MKRSRLFFVDLNLPDSGADAQKKIFILMLCLLLYVTISPAHSRAEMVFIPVQFRSAADVLPIVKDLLSRDGTASVDHRTNSLVIRDNSEAIENIRLFLLRFDKPARQVRIRFRFQEVSSTGKRAIAAEGNLSGDNWEISTGRKKQDGIDVRVKDRNRTQRTKSEFFVRVDSGSSAYILVGQDIPFRKRWIDLSRRYAGVRESVDFHRIESGMEVRPVIVGDRAHIEITPRISHEVKRGKRETIMFAGASTKLSVPLGQWRRIGGAEEESNEVIRAILESGAGSERSSLSMSFMVEAD